MTETQKITIDAGDSISENTIDTIINCLNDTNQLRTTEYVNSAKEWHYITNEDGEIDAFIALKDSYIDYYENDYEDEEDEECEDFSKTADYDIGYLYVKPELRNKGIGKALFNSVLENNKDKVLGFSRINFDKSYLEEKGFTKVKEFDSFVEGRTIEYYVNE